LVAEYPGIVSGSPSDQIGKFELRYFAVPNKIIPISIPMLQRALKRFVGGQVAKSSWRPRSSRNALSLHAKHSRRDYSQSRGKSWTLGGPGYEIPSMLPIFVVSWQFAFIEGSNIQISVEFNRLFLFLVL
jgi:hypothetical protein